MAELDPNDYIEWHDKVYHPAATKINGREEAVRELRTLFPYTLFPYFFPSIS
jgi:hypothetical protein